MCVWIREWIYVLHVTQIGKATEEEKNKLQQQQQEKEEENGISDFKSRQFVNQLPSEEIASQVLPCYVVYQSSQQALLSPSSARPLVIPVMRRMQ